MFNYKIPKRLFVISIILKLKLNYNLGMNDVQ